ncbi:uncharacterized protein [Haliotis cracherodii]|uniref:uncharacterized protein n=1 Tax=Haliotis cracherodii TaxID=6455 RepID=UPI0039EAA967
MDSASFKSVIVCGQCGEWFGDTLSQVQHMTTHTFTTTASSSVGTKMALDFMQRCDRDASGQSEYDHADAADEFSFDKGSLTADDTSSNKENETEADNQAAPPHQRDRLHIYGEWGESLDDYMHCDSHWKQVHSENDYTPSSAREHEMDKMPCSAREHEMDKMGSHWSHLCRDWACDSVHFEQPHENCEDLSGSEMGVQEHSRVLCSGTAEDSQDAESESSDLEHVCNEGRCTIEHQSDATPCEVEAMSTVTRSSGANGDESIASTKCKIDCGNTCISAVSKDSCGTLGGIVYESKFSESNSRNTSNIKQNVRQGKMKVYLNTELGKRKYSSGEGSSYCAGSMNRNGSLWDDGSRTDLTRSSSVTVTDRSVNAGRRPEPSMEDCLGVKDLNSITMKDGHVEHSADIQAVMVLDSQGKKYPPDKMPGTWSRSFYQDTLEQSEGFRRTSDTASSTVDIKPYPAVTDTHNLSHSLMVGFNSCSGAESMPNTHFATDMNHNKKSFPGQFIKCRNQFSDEHERTSSPRKCKNRDNNFDNLSFILKKNKNCKSYSIHKAQFMEETRTGSPLSKNRDQQYGYDINETEDYNHKRHVSDSSLLFENKHSDFIYSSVKLSNHLNHQNYLPLEQHSPEGTRSGNSCTTQSLSGVWTHRCSVCGERFEAARDLQKHLISHKQQCNVCGEGFVELENLNAHLDMHLKDADEDNGDEGKDEEDLQHQLSGDVDAPDHAIKPHELVYDQGCAVKDPPKKSYRCEICSKLFVAKQTLRIHMNIHLGRRSTCPVCKQTFSTKWSQKRHADKYHNKVKVCEKSFSSPNSLNIYKASKDFIQQEDMNSFTCEVCKRGFLSIKSLNNHSRTHRNRVEELQQYMKTFRCKECGQMYSRQESLIAHMNVHGDKYMHSCESCFVGFSTLMELDSHMQQHNNVDEKLNICSICGRGFDLHTTLIHHVQQCRSSQQDTRRELNPPVCGMVFEDIKVMERDKEKKFQCPVCSKKYLRRKSLRHHMKMKKHLASV